MTDSKLVILDRDGVINEDSDNYIKSAEEWVPIAGSIEAIAKLSKAGFSVYIATNQSGLSRGYFTLDTLAAMHDKLLGLVNSHGGHIAGIFFCPHLPSDQCNCRKPAAGLVDQIEQASGQSAQGAYFIGDSLKDLQAAATKQCRPILVKTGKGLRTIEQGLGSFSSVPIHEDLSQAAEAILQGVT